MRNTHTYDVEGEVVIAADVAHCIFRTAVVDSIVIRTGVRQCKRSVFVVDFVALL